MKKEKHTLYNYQFKHTAVSVANHPEIQTQYVAEALEIHPFMLSSRESSRNTDAICC